ncbi:alpha/beta hydrolase [Baaleninema sp.]|uniref:alpha/beta hydrolase n=1 Tax=Baaleninema sp. TaxID=3101197 RepID=UPI003D03C347
MVPFLRPLAFFARSRHRGFSPSVPNRWRLWGILSIGFSMAWGQPSLGAQEIAATYGLFERTLSIDALEAYAKTGQVDGELAPYLNFAPRNSRDTLRNVLLARAELDPVAVSQFLYTPQGEVLLQRLGQAIQSGSGVSGFKGLRSALILAAADEDGLTLLNVLRHFPTPTLRVNFNQTFRMAQQLQTLVNASETALSEVREQSEREADREDISPSPVADLSQPGKLSWDKLSMTLRDPNRNPPWGHRFPVDLYVPQTPDPAPIIVISHGLGSDRSAFRYLAEHLASHGFAVFVPEHSGSNAKHMEALLAGQEQEIAKPQEFIDRPLDVTFLLDTLTVLSRTDPQLENRFDFDRVGVVGQSFGGYTALTLAGAELDLTHLARACALAREEQSWNVSLLLQCRAQAISSQQQQFRDPRIRGAIAINPVGSALFGETGYQQIEIPLAVIAGGADTVAPALPEQIQPFTWLTLSQRYLFLLEGGTHFSTIGESGEEAVPLPSAVVGPAPDLARDYVKILSLAFFQTYVVDNPAFRDYLSPAYVRSLSRASLPLYGVRQLDASTVEASCAAVSGCP